jgi:1-deoxy-D-xylulose-5-phosphate reductoisomerase
MAAQGTAACALNAANEEAVAAYLDRKISFLEIGQLNEYCIQNVANILDPQYEDYVTTDAKARAFVQAQFNK